jgi:hypothetical protein
MSRAGSRTLQRSRREIPSEAVELSAIEDTRNYGEAIFHVMHVTVPHNVPHQRRAADVSL